MPRRAVGEEWWVGKMNGGRTTFHSPAHHSPARAEPSLDPPGPHKVPVGGSERRRRVGAKLLTAWWTSRPRGGGL